MHHSNARQIILFYRNISVVVDIKQKQTTKNKTLFLDCRNLGHMIDRAHRDLSEEDIVKITTTYKNFVNGKDIEELGYAHAADMDEIETNLYVLTPGRYVGLEEMDDDGEAFEDKMQRLTEELKDLFDESNELEKKIKEQLGAIGYGI